MSDETTTQEQAEEAPPPDEVEETDNVLRMLWPYHPSYFGIRVLTTALEIDSLQGMTAEERAPLIDLIGQGMAVLMVEATVENHGEMLAIQMAALQASRRFGKGGAQA